MMDAIRSAFRNYVNFQGRSKVSDYWWWFLFVILVFVVLRIIDGALGLASGTGYATQNGLSASAGYGGGFGLLSGLFSLAILLPNLAVAVRRLHDTDRSGWWLLIGLIPLIGGIVLLVFYVSSGTAGTNKYGPDPRNPNDLGTIFGK